MDGDKGDKIIWAKWSLLDDGRIKLTATYGSHGALDERELTFESLDDAAQALGESFREVVSRVSAAGYSTGRWRP